MPGVCRKEKPACNEQNKENCMKKAMYIAVFVSLFVLSSCELLDEIASDGKEEYITATVDGEERKFNGFLGVNTTLGITTVKGTEMRLADDNGMITLFFAEGATGTKAIITDAEKIVDNKAAANYTVPGSLDTYQATSGEIVIDTNDEDLVEGTFEFTAAFGSRKIEITDGKFKVKKE